MSSDDNSSDSEKRSKYAIVNFAKDIGFDTFNTLKYFRHNLKLGLSRENHFQQESQEPPIILLQGFLGTSGVLQPLDRYLQGQGRNVFMLDLGIINIGDIRKSAELLVYEVERLIDLYSKKHNFKKVDIVAHSMGGLIAYYYVKKLGGHRAVRKLITLGTPFRGTWAALLGTAMFGLLSRGVSQMLPRSQFLKELHAPNRNRIRTKVYSLAAQYDTISPPESCFLKGATNRILPLGHASLLIDKRVFQNIVLFLEGEENRSNVVEFEHFRT
jgi:triacylglycerol lipase